MIQRLLLLLLSSIFLISCQNEQLDSETTDTSSTEGTSVKFTFTFPQSLESSTEYSPMKKSQDENLYPIQISNIYKAIITKKVGSLWIIDQVLTPVIDETPEVWTPIWNNVANESKVADFSVVLRPGEYKITIITGVRSINWNASLAEGLIVDNEDNPDHIVPMACAYRTIDEGYFHSGWDGLEEEIFSGAKNFTVEKTEDLHSPSKITPINLQLNRMVTKVRAVLDNTPYNASSYTFPNVFNNTIVAHLVTDDPTGFPTGLNIWGEPYYDSNNIISELRYAVYTGTDEMEVNNVKYLVPVKRSMRQFTTYFFTDPQKDFQATVSDITVTYQQGGATYWTDDEFKLPLKNNYITGFILKPGNSEENRTIVETGGSTSTQLYRQVLVEYESGTIPKNPADLFDYNIEYR